MFRFFKSPVGIAIGVAAVLIASPKARKGLRKMAVKTVSVFIRTEEKVRDSGSEMEENFPEAKEAVRKVAVKITSPILAIVEVVQDTVSKIQKKLFSRESLPTNEQVIHYDNSIGIPQY